MSDEADALARSRLLPRSPTVALPQRCAWSFPWSGGRGRHV